VRIAVRKERELLRAEETIQIEADLSAHDVLASDVQDGARLADGVEQEVQRREVRRARAVLRVKVFRVLSVRRRRAGEIDVQEPEDGAAGTAAVSHDE